MSNIIELRNVHKYYPLGKERLHVLKSIDLDIKKGDFVMIMGKSGSGKSTLLNLLGFLDRFDEGEYIYKGENITELKENQRSEFRNTNIGFVFQQFNLIEALNVYQNVEIPMIYNNKYNKSQKENIIKEKLELVGLADKIYSKPTHLSGGQQQRITIARSLVNDPEIIFADEPTGALDSETGVEVMNLLKELNSKGKTIIMVTHDSDLVSYATKVVNLKDGKIVEVN